MIGTGGCNSVRTIKGGQTHALRSVQTRFSPGGILNGFLGIWGRGSTHYQFRKYCVFREIDGGQGRLPTAFDTSLHPIYRRLPSEVFDLKPPNATGSRQVVSDRRMETTSEESEADAERSSSVHLGGRPWRPPWRTRRSRAAAISGSPMRPARACPVGSGEIGKVSQVGDDLLPRTVAGTNVLDQLPVAVGFAALS
jgi:hypothetical protein